MTVPNPDRHLPKRLGGKHARKPGRLDDDIFRPLLDESERGVLPVCKEVGHLDELFHRIAREERDDKDCGRKCHPERGEGGPRRVARDVAQHHQRRLRNDPVQRKARRRQPAITRRRGRLHRNGRRQADGILERADGTDDGCGGAQRASDRIKVRRLREQQEREMEEVTKQRGDA